MPQVEEEDPLAKYIGITPTYADEEDADPLAKYRSENKQQYRDVVGEGILKAQQDKAAQRAQEQVIPQEEVQQENPEDNLHEIIPGTGIYGSKNKKSWSEAFNEVGNEDENEIQRAAEKGIGDTTRGMVKGATLGLSQLIPDIDPGLSDEVKFSSIFKTDPDNPAETAGTLIGSAIPITAMMNAMGAPLVALAARSPILATQLQALAHLTGVGLAGGTYGVIEQATDENKPKPTVDDFLEHGAEWALLDGAFQLGGKAIQAAAAFASKGKETGKPAWKVVNETINQMKKEGVDFSNPERVQAKAMSILEDVGKERVPLGETRTVNQPQKEFLENTEKRIQEMKDTKVSPHTLEPLTGRAEELATPNINYVFEEPGQVLNEGLNNAITEDLEILSERAATEKQLGENIKADVEAGMKKAKAEYDPAYKLAEEASETINTVPRRTAKVSSDILKDLGSLETMPEGYKATMNVVETAFRDAGYVVERDAYGRFVQAVSASDQPVNKLMNLAKRLNKIINYDTIDYEIKHKLKDIVKALKDDIRGALKDHPDALGMYNDAERLFGESAEKFGRDSIRKIRAQEAGEKTAKLIRNPTALADVKQVVSPRQFAQIEREMLEHMRNLNEAKAAAFYREISPSLSVDAQVIAEDILQSKMPTTGPIRSDAIRNQVREAVINDISKSTITGERPSTALNLWKTPKGQQLIESALEGNPNKAEVINYLKEQSFYDFASGFIEKDGQVNFTKLAKLLKDPATIANIRKLGGEEAVTMFRNLEKISGEIEQGMENLQSLQGEKQQLSKSILGEHLVPEKKALQKAAQIRGTDRLKKMAKKDYPYQTYINGFIKGMHPETKAVLAALGIYNAPLTAKAYIAYKVFMKIAKNKRLRTALRQAAGSRRDPRAYITALEAIDKQMED